MSRRHRDKRTPSDNSAPRASPSVPQLQDYKLSVPRPPRLPILISVLALLVSALGFYFSNLRVSHKFHLTTAAVETDHNNLKTITFKLIVSNPGNRDAALLNVEPVVWMMATEAMKQDMDLNRRILERHPSLNDGAALPMSDNEWLPLQDQKRSDLPTIVKPGSISVVTVSGTLDEVLADPSHIYTKVLNGKSDAAIAFGANVLSADSYGTRYRIKAPIAYYGLGALKHFMQGHTSSDVYLVHDARPAEGTVNLFDNRIATPDFDGLARTPFRNSPPYDEIK
jgi:hypothetical protein